MVVHTLRRYKERERRKCSLKVEEIRNMLIRRMNTEQPIEKRRNDRTKFR